MIQQLLEDLEALREAHRTAKTQDDFEALTGRVQAIEALLATASERSRSENAALERVKALVLEAIQAKRDGRDQPASFSGAVFTLMQAVRRGTSGFDG